MSASLSLRPDLEEIRDQADQVTVEVLDGLVDAALEAAVEPALEAAVDSQGVDHVIEDAVDRAIDAAASHRLTPEQLKASLTADLQGRIKGPLVDSLKGTLLTRIRRAIKRGVRGPVGQLVWAVIEGVDHADRLGAGVSKIWQAGRELLSRTPAKLRERAELALERGNEDRYKRLMAQAEEREAELRQAGEGGRGNG